MRPDLLTESRTLWFNSDSQQLQCVLFFIPGLKSLVYPVNLIELYIVAEIDKISFLWYWKYQCSSFILPQAVQKIHCASDLSAARNWISAMALSHSKQRVAENEADSTSGSVSTVNANQQGKAQSSVLKFMKASVFSQQRWDLWCIKIHNLMHQICGRCTLY